MNSVINNFKPREMKKIKYKVKNSQSICEEIRSDEDLTRLKKITDENGDVSFQVIYDGIEHTIDEETYFKLKKVLEDTNLIY